MSKDHAIGFGIGLVAGAVIGGVVALLYAPKAGKATRKLIKDAATGVVDTVKEKSGGVIDTLNEVTSEVNRKGHAAAHALKN